MCVFVCLCVCRDTTELPVSSKADLEKTCSAMTALSSEWVTGAVLSCVTHWRSVWSDQIEQMKARSCSSQNETDTLLVTQNVLQKSKHHHISNPASFHFLVLLLFPEKSFVPPPQFNPQLVYPPLCFLMSLTACYFYNKVRDATLVAHMQAAITWPR